MILAAWSLRSARKYLFWTFGVSWGVWIPVLFVSYRHEEVQNLLVLGAFGPGLAALVVSRHGSVLLIASQALKYIASRLFSWLVCSF